MILEPFRLPQKRRSPALWVLLVGIFLLTYALSWVLIQRPASDLSIHTTWAGEGDFRDLTSFLHHVANPLWHCIVAVTVLMGVPLEIASALVTALFKTAEVWIIHRLLSVALHDRLSPTRIALAALVSATVSGVCLPWYNPTVYLGVGTPNTWHSSTQLSALVFMLLCVPYTAWCYDRFEELEPSQGPKAILPWPCAITLGVLLFMSLLSKPTFMQAFLPAACLFFLVKWIRHPRSSRFFVQIILVVLPSVAYMLIQYMYYYGIIVPHESSMVLQLSGEKALHVLIRTVLLYAFPLYTLWSSRKQKKDTFFWLTLLFNVVGILEFLLLGEDGRRSEDGNFGWGMMGAALMMWVMCLIRFLRQEQRSWPGWALIGWHWLSGLYYIYYLFTTDVPL